MKQLIFLDDGIESGAIFSECRKYRYVLWRKWDKNLPMITFIGLNPSTANENTDDATIRRVKNFARNWGYGGAYMCNLFAYVSTDPKRLKYCEDPIGDNDKYLNRFCGESKDVLFAWGSFDVFGRDEQVIKMFPNGLALGVNSNGSPKHPLYIAKEVRPYAYSVLKDL